MKRNIGIFLLLILFSQTIVSASSYSSNSFSTIEDRKDKYLLSQQSRASEELKVLIGTPTTIDEDDPIPVVVAGMRDAKSVYIKPIRIKIELLSFDSSLSETDNGEQVVIASKESWYFEDQWISENASTSITRLNDYLYQTEFDPLHQEVTIEIKAYVDWVSPWNEVFTSEGSKIIEIGKWRNYTQYLQTSADEIQSTKVDSFQDDVGDATEALNDVSEKMKDIQVFLENKEALKDLGVEDPSYFHFYLLNISTIVDWTNPNITSYVEQLPNTGIYADGKSEKQYYYDMLQEINQAFIESLKLLDKKGIPYTITYVNYTYTDTRYDRSIDYLGQTINAEDIDWDDENLIDTSFEFLLESTSWTGHPDLIHQNLFVNLSGPPIGNYTLKDLLEQYNADVINPVLQYNYDGTPSEWRADQTYPYDDGNDVPTKSRLQYVEMYQGYVEIYKNDSGSILQLQEGFDYNLFNTTEIQFLTSQEGTNLLIEIEKPGGWRKDNKAIIVNLMGDLFPLLSRFYTVPRGLADPVPETDYNEYYLDPTNGSFILPPIVQCSFSTSYNGELNDTYIEQNINYNIDNFNAGLQTVNLTDYVLRLDGLSSGVPYWINTVMKPFSRFVYDNNLTNGDSYNDDYNETDFHNYIKSYFEETLLEAGYEVPELSLFSLMDIAIHFTGDEGGGSVQPHQTNPWDVFYKNSWGDWIDSFFNGTNLLNGADRTDDNYTGPDSTYAYPGSWTFRYIDRDVTDVSTESLPSEYVLSPFQGPSDYVPIGVMTLGRVMFIQNSLYNLTSGFGYGYGLIYNIYRRAYDANKAMLLQILSRLSSENNTEGVAAVQKDIEILDQAWDDLNLTLIDEIGRKIDDYLSNPSNPYTATNGKSLYHTLLGSLETSVNNALDRLSRNEAKANEIDTSLEGTTYDVRKLGILEEIQSYLKNQLLPWIYSLNTSIATIIDGFASGFNDTVDRITVSINKSIDTFNTTLKNWNDWLKGNITSFSENINESAKLLGSQLGTAIQKLWSGLITAGGIIAIAGIGISTDWQPQKIAIGIMIGIGIATAIGAWKAFSSENEIGTYVENLGYKISGTIVKVTEKVYDGMDTVRTGVTASLYRASIGIATVGNRLKDVVSVVSQTVKAIINRMTEIGILIIQQVILIVKAINETLTLVKDIIKDIFEKIGEVFNEVKRVFSQVSDYIIQVMGESLGRVQDVMKETAGTIFEKLKYVGEKLKNHTAFIKIENLFNKIVEATIAAGFSLYSAEHGELNEEQVLRWADTMQPLAEIQSADRGFYVFQMGDEFAEELYYVVVYQGQLIDPDEIDFRIRRFSDLSEYGGEGYDILEAYPTIQKFRTNSSDPSTEIDGIYYLNFTEGQRLIWYKTNSTEPYVEAGSPAGNYLTLFNCTLFNREEWNGEDIETYWVEKTILYTKEYITDAFPVIHVEGYDPNDPEPFVIKAGGESQLFTITIENKMWSYPYVQVDFILTTQGSKSLDGGTALSQIRYNNVSLAPEGETQIAVEWGVGKYTPSGNHRLLIVVTESNGDVTIASVPIYVEQSNIFVDFLSSFFTTGYGWGAISLTIGIIIYGSYQMSKRENKIKKFYF